MPLIMNTINSDKFDFAKKFEMMGNMFVLVSIELQYINPGKLYMQERPYHWRLDDKKGPPFDISVDSKSGNLKEIVFFIENKKINIEKLPLSNLDRSGNPSFDLSTFNNNTFHYDEYGSVEYTLFKDTLYCIFASSSLDFSNNKIIIKQEKSLEYILDGSNQLIGVGINLIETEMEVLEEAKLL